MSMQSHVTFNVSYKGQHFFATAEHSCSTYDTAKAAKLAEVLAAKFPASEGYEVSATRWEGTGHILNVDSLLKSIKR